MSQTNFYENKPAKFNKYEQKSNHQTKKKPYYVVDYSAHEEEVKTETKSECPKFTNSKMSGIKLKPAPEYKPKTVTPVDDFIITEDEPVVEKKKDMFEDIGPSENSNAMNSQVTIALNDENKKPMTNQANSSNPKSSQKPKSKPTGEKKMKKAFAEQPSIGKSARFSRF